MATARLPLAMQPSPSPSPSPSRDALLDASLFDLILDTAGDLDAALSPPAASSASCDELLSALSDAEHAPDSTSSSSDGGAAPTKPKPRRRMSQTQRVRAEQQHLRAQIADLERRLAAAMVKRALAETRAPPTAWRAVARRQRARRREAEQLNDVLRGRLHRQLQVAKALDAVLAKRAEVFLSQLEPQPWPSQWPLDLAAAGDLDAVINRMLDDIHEAYDAIDTVFPDPVSDEIVVMDDRPPTRSSIRSHDHKGVEQFYIETRQSFTSPFDLTSVAGAIWPAVTSEYARQRRELERYDVGENVYAAKVKIVDDEVLGLPGVENTMTIAMKVFVEDTRVTLIMRGLKTAEFGGDSEVVAVGATWLMFRGHPKVDGQVAVDVCSRVVPVCCPLSSPLTVSPPPLTMDVPVGAMTSQMMCTSGDDIAFLADAIETMALDESLKSSDSPTATTI